MIIAKRISIKAFTYDKKTNTFATEISSLEEGAPFSQAFDDACDQGFQMVGVTEKKVLFTLRSVLKETEGDIAGWNFISYRNNPEFKCFIAND